MWKISIVISIVHGAIMERRCKRGGGGGWGRKEKGYCLIDDDDDDDDDCDGEVKSLVVGFCGFVAECKMVETRR